MSKEIKSQTALQTIAKLSDPAYQINGLARMIHEDADRHGLWDDFREAMRRFEDREDSARLSALENAQRGVRRRTGAVQGRRAGLPARAVPGGKAELRQADEERRRTI